MKAAAADQFVRRLLGAATLLLSVKPILNLCSKQQVMNATYNPLHLVGSYGAFGSVTRRRYEVVLEGTLDDVLSETTHWDEYEFKAKPGKPTRRARQWSPYHLRLDWLMWFLPLRAVVTRNGVSTRGHPVWLMRLVRKLLSADRATLALLRPSPFGLEPPRHVRASLYSYEMVAPAERRRAGVSWRRTYVGEYLLAQSRRANEESPLDD
jgi:hypothetical protein